MTLGKLMLVTVVLTFPVIANASIIVNQYGDMDGLGIGVTHGAAFNYRTVDANDPADTGTITDRWISGSRSWNHTLDLTAFGPITDLALELFTGGQGYRGLSKVYVNDIFVGHLTDGDGFDGGNRKNQGWRDIFDLSGIAGLLTGPISIEVKTLLGGDGWALDYSKLIAKTAAVPEPGTLLLMALGVACLVLRRRMPARRAA